MQLLDIPIEVLDVMVTNKAVIGKTMAELARLEYANGVFVRKIMRAGQELPISAMTRIDRGDLLRLIGTKPKSRTRGARKSGYPDRPTTATDMVFVGTGIVLGGLVGVLSVTVAGIPLTLTASGGALVMGLVFGWLRSAYPFFGRIPEPAIWIFDTLGLCVFIGVVGLNAGPSFIAGLKTIRHQPDLRRPCLGAAAAHARDSVRTLRAEDEPTHRARRVRRRRDDHGRAARDPGRGAEQRSGVGLHGAVCDRKHRADGMGPGTRRTHVGWKMRKDL